MRLQLVWRARSFLWTGKIPADVQLDTDLGGSVLRQPESLFGGAFGIQLPLMSGRGGVWFGAAGCR